MIRRMGKCRDSDFGLINGSNTDKQRLSDDADERFQRNVNLVKDNSK